MHPDLIAHFRRELVAAFYATRAQHFTLRRKRTPSEWARDERIIGQGTSPLAQTSDIRYDVDLMPWCREPMDSAVDPEVQITVLWWASAMGKTDGVVSNIIGHSIVDEPKNIFAVYPKEESRDKFSRDVIERMIAATPTLRSLFGESKHRDSARTIAYKRFVAGSLFLTSAGSASNFRGPRAGLVFNDEVDGYPEDVDGEGDPIFLSHKRAEGFANAIKIIAGTGTIARTTDKDGKTIYRSKIDEWFDKSDRRKWFCPCRRCGKLQALSFGQVKAIARKSGAHFFYLCESCDAEHTDTQRVRMVRDGKWLPTAPFDGIRGYWLNGVNSTLPAEKGFRSKLHQFVKDAERAERGGQFTKRVWINTFLADLDSPESEGEPPPEWRTIHARRESYTAPPVASLVITAMVDVQVNRLEVEWRAWGRDEQSWGLDHLTLDGNTKDVDVWRNRLCRELARTFAREDGAPMTLDIGFIDGGWAAEYVYDFTRWLAAHPAPGVTGKVRASKGIGQHGHPIIDPRWRTIAKNLKGYHVGTWEAKDWINQRLRMDDQSAAGAMHYPQSYGELYFQQLCTGIPTIVFEKGQEVRKFLNEAHHKDEGLDLAVGNLAAFRLRRWNFDAIAADLAQRAKIARGEVIPETIEPAPWFSGQPPQSSWL